MSGYIGTQPVPQATQTRDAFTCTAGQTSFATSGYTPSFLDVYLNGIKLAAADYTASNGSDVVLASGAALNDILEVVAYTSFEVVTDTVTNAGTVLNLDRTGSDGTILDLKKDGSTVGSIGTFNSGGTGLTVGASGVGLYFRQSADSILPWSMTTNYYKDNSIDLGDSGSRFDDIYATNGTIQTSDRNEKQDIASLTPTEMLVAARLSTGFKNFRWKDSVADKGDNARTHTGVIAQDVQAAFTAEGLDAGDYALFTSATWWETQTDVPAVEADEDNEIEAADAYTRTDTYETLAEAPAGATERTRMGIRYPELLAFVGAYNEQRFASIETRLTALETLT